jgi:phosphoglycolate phosphatase-like HAD superfamily hydrolase
MTYRSMGSGIYIRKGAAKSLEDVDGIIFDCDGVLVDVTKSYDLAIKKTTALVLEKLTGTKSIPITSGIIRGFKETGGFNDEVDLTYAAILSLASARKLGADPKRFVSKVIKNADYTGIKSVEKFLDKLRVDISDIRKKLDYPGPHSTNPLYQTFDQIFYGPRLYEKIFGKKSHLSGRGLIENDRVILTMNLAKSLQKKFGKKTAIVTGRGRQSIRYSLKKLLDSFDLRSSVFLEDKPRNLAKPNPKALLMAIAGIKSRHCIYVGDSMEDLLMAKKANKLGRKVTFCGICGTGRGAASRKKFFEKNGAPIILESIKLIPKTLNLVK